ncbi:hypothetical protein BDZ45DRAFT_691960 [Acephala macrosclerotiorum]|nr:hypothetical protein BDZ45DRAFT_691960 [Acephala macrosclerotiorum]
MIHGLAVPTDWFLFITPAVPSSAFVAARSRAPSHCWIRPGRRTSVESKTTSPDRAAYTFQIVYSIHINISFGLLLLLLFSTSMMDERTQLLPESSSQTPFSETTTFIPTISLYICESLKLAAATAPISLSFAMQNVVQACSIMIAGKLGTFELGVASYGYMFAICTRSMVAVCGSTALNTLCGQAFDPRNLSRNVDVLGILLQRGILVLSLPFIRVIAPIWWFFAGIFMTLRQDEEFARDTGVFLNRMIPGGLLRVAECLKKFLQWSFETLAMMAASLNGTSVGAQSISLATPPYPHVAQIKLTLKYQILMTFDLIFTTISLCLGVATSHRIGNFLDTNKPTLAKLMSGVPHILAPLVGLTEFITIMTVKNVYGYLFSTNKEVMALTAQVIPLMAGFQILDLANGGAGGFLRGAGKNHDSVVCKFVAYCGAGLTSAWYLGFRLELGLVGLWVGIITGSFALLVLQVGFIGRIEWEKEARWIAEGYWDMYM